MVLILHLQDLQVVTWTKVDPELGQMIQTQHYLRIIYNFTSPTVFSHSETKHNFTGKCNRKIKYKIKQMPVKQDSN